jgi:threonine synthase
MLLASHIVKLECVLCGATYTSGSVSYTCQNCGPQGTLLVHYDYDQIRWNFHAESRDPSIRRYRAFLPISYGQRLSPLISGGTPFYQVERLRKHLGLRNLWLKDETRNPSGSLKDRGAFVAVALAGERQLVLASTGNAAMALAIQAAAVGLSCNLLLPQRGARAAPAALVLTGARVFEVEGSYEDAFELSVEAANKFGWYNVNTGYNPYIVEGLKTIGLEIAEQLGQAAPDAILVPTGDGGLISAIYRAFEDLRHLGMVKGMPRLIAVQSEGAPALVRALEEGASLRAYPVSTEAASLAVALPHNGAMAVRHIRESGGSGIVVSDEALREAQQELARLTGVVTEPAGAAGSAALRQLLAEGKIERNDRVVLVASGEALRSTEASRPEAGQVVQLARGSEGLATLERLQES